MSTLRKKVNLFVIGNGDDVVINMLVAIYFALLMH